MGIGKTTIRPSGFTAPIQASRFTTSGPCWPTASKRPIGHRSIAEGRHRSTSATERPGLLRRMLRLRRRENAQTEAIRGRHERPRSTSRTSRASLSAATGCRWCGISCWRWQHRHTRAATWTARQRRRIRRPASHRRRGLARGVRARTGDNPAAAPRRKPDYCLNIGITSPGLVALEMNERVPNLSFKSFGAFTEGAARRAELVGDVGASSPQNWSGGFGTGNDHVLVTLHAISPEAMQRYSDRVCAWFAEGNAFREIWRQDGMALMEMQDGQPVPTSKTPLRLYRRHLQNHHSRRPGKISRRSPAALRTMALRLAGRR